MQNKPFRPAVIPQDVSWLVLFNLHPCFQPLYQSVEPPVLSMWQKEIKLISKRQRKVRTDLPMARQSAWPNEWNMVPPPLKSRAIIYEVEHRFKPRDIVVEAFTIWILSWDLGKERRCQEWVHAFFLRSGSEMHKRGFESDSILTSYAPILVG